MADPAKDGEHKATAMRLRHILLIVLIAVPTLVAASCAPDPPREQVSAKWTGVLAGADTELSVRGFERPTQPLYLTRVVRSSGGFASFASAAAKVENATVTVADGLTGAHIEADVSLGTCSPNGCFTDPATHLSLDVSATGPITTGPAGDTRPAAGTLVLDGTGYNVSALLCRTTDPTANPAC